MTNNRSLLSSTALSGALAVSALVVAAGAAHAATATFNGGNNVTLATQTVNAAGTVSLQNGQTIVITGAGTESCQANSTLTITAPTGTLFAAAPSIAFSGVNNANLSANAGVVNPGSSSVTYTLTGTLPFVNGSIATLGATGGINLTGATAFASPVATARTFGVSTLACTNNFATGLTTTGGLASSSGVALGVSNAGTTATVDTTAAGAGKLFVTSATNSARVATLGQLSVVATANTVNAANGAAWALPDNSALTVTASGPFSAASRVYLATGTCTTTAGGALPAGNILGVVSGGTATFASSAVNQAYNLCYENNSTNLIPAGSGNNLVAINASGVVSTVPGATASANIGNLVYSGNSTLLTYVTGGSAYQYFVRVTNPNSAPTSVFVVVTRDDGSVFSGSVNTNLGANFNALYSVTDLNTATGANLTAADRARVQVLTSAATAPVSGLLFNTATGVIAPAN